MTMSDQRERYIDKYPDFAKFNEALTLAGEIDPDRRDWHAQYRTYITHLTPQGSSDPNATKLCMGFVLELKIRSPNSPMYGGTYEHAMVHLQKLHDEIVSMMPVTEHITFVMRPYEQGSRRITGVAFQVAVEAEAGVNEAAMALTTVAINLPGDQKNTQALTLSSEGFI